MSVLNLWSECQKHFTNSKLLRRYKHCVDWVSTMLKITTKWNAHPLPLCTLCGGTWTSYIMYFICFTSLKFEHQKNIPNWPSFSFCVLLEKKLLLQHCPEEREQWIGTTTVEPLGSVTRQSKILRIKLVLWRERKKQVMSSKKKEDWRGDYGKREESWW